MKKTTLGCLILLGSISNAIASIGTYGASEARTYTYVLEQGQCNLIPTNVRQGLFGLNYTQPTNTAIILFTKQGKFPIFSTEDDCISYNKQYGKPGLFD